MTRIRFVYCRINKLMNIYAFYIELYEWTTCRFLVEYNIFAITSLISSDKPATRLRLLSRSLHVHRARNRSPNDSLRNENVAAMGARSVSSFARNSRNREWPFPATTDYRTTSNRRRQIRPERIIPASGEQRVSEVNRS